MKKWILDKIDKDDFWLSYYPNFICLFMNCASLYFSAYRNFTTGLLRDFVVFIGCFGIAWSLKGFYIVYSYKRDKSKYFSELDKLIFSLTPELDKIMQEEMNIQGRSKQESLKIAQERIAKFIHSECRRRKIGSSVSKSDKT